MNATTDNKMFTDQTLGRLNLLKYICKWLKIY